MHTVLNDDVTHAVQPIDGQRGQKTHKQWLEVLHTHTLESTRTHTYTSAEACQQHWHVAAHRAVLTSPLEGLSDQG